jgi:hypothetical protein
MPRLSTPPAPEGRPEPESSVRQVTRESAAEEAPQSNGSVEADRLPDTMSNATPEQRAAMIRQYQDRILLLQHAYHCESSGACPVPNCGTMKALWGHITNCKKTQCEVLSARSFSAVLVRCADLWSVFLFIA